MRPLAFRHDEIHRFVLYFTTGLADVVAAEVKEIISTSSVIKKDERFLIVALPSAEAARLGNAARTIEISGCFSPVPPTPEPNRISSHSALRRPLTPNRPCFLKRQRQRSGSTVAATDLLHQVFTHDVRRGPDPRVAARVLVGDMPWGKQTKADGRLALFDATALLVAHTVRQGGSAVLLTTHEDQFLPRLRRHRLRVSARRIGLLGQTPAIVVARPA